MKISEEMISRAKELREAGHSWRSIGRELGVTHQSIKRHLDEEYRLRRNQKSARFRENNPDYGRNYYLEHGAGHYPSQAPHLHRERQNKYRVSRVGGDFDHNCPEIQALYLCAHKLTEETGIEYQVDHIIPVSKGGSHIYDNLQILTKEQNRAKSTYL